MNTGYQKSSTTPRGAWTSTTQVGSTGRGKESHAKDMPLLMAMHDVPYVATATLSNLEDYAAKLLKAKEAKKHGLAYIHLYTPCPTGWKLAPDSTIEMCRNAVESNFFPLWEAEYGNVRLTYEPKEATPLKSFIKMARKFSHLSDEDIQSLQEQLEYRYSRLQKLAGVC
jgi:pyruvate/2-oxoacid:ferredoxin oxidoreductase beta subunit